jgi:amidophosphoribosyltransferase
LRSRYGTRFLAVAEFEKHMSQPEDKPRHYCGVFGIANCEQAAEITRMGLTALQHRGQESAGIFVLRDGQCELHKDMGLVGDVFRRLPKEWWRNPQNMAIGHVRYSTAGSSSLDNAQPIVVEFDKWNLALAHNGNLSNGGVLRDQLKRNGAIFRGSSDTEVILHLAARRHDPGEPPWRALRSALADAEGAFSLVALCEDGMIAARDPHGFRPLVMGRNEEGSVVFASESCAFDMTGTTYEREVLPGEFIHVALDGTVTSKFLPRSPRQAFCIFELIYFSRPDSVVFGECVYELRKEYGRRLAEEAPCDADVIMPIPDGGIYAALGYAEASGIPFDLGIMRNHYVGRTFIRPEEADRKAAVKLKLNPIRNAIEGKRVCLIEDSIVRGNTSRERVKTLRACGATEVHIRISCPPHVSPCYYGIDFPSKEELIANNYTQDEIAKLIDVDSLHYLSLEGMLGCVREAAPEDFCHACFSAEYPVEPRGLINRS